MQTLRTHPCSFSTRSMALRTWLVLGDAKTVPQAAAVCGQLGDERRGREGQTGEHAVAWMGVSDDIMDAG